MKAYDKIKKKSSSSRQQEPADTRGEAGSRSKTHTAGPEGLTQKRHKGTWNKETLRNKTQDLKRKHCSGRKMTLRWFLECGAKRKTGEADMTVASKECQRGDSSIIKDRTWDSLLEQRQHADPLSLHNCTVRVRSDAHQQPWMPEDTGQGLQVLRLNDTEPRILYLTNLWTKQEGKRRHFQTNKDQRAYLPISFLRAVGAWGPARRVRKMKKGEDAETRKKK